MSLLGFLRRFRRKTRLWKIVLFCIVCVILFLIFGYIRKEISNNVRKPPTSTMLKHKQEITQLSHPVRNQKRQSVETETITAEKISTSKIATTTEITYTEPAKPKLNENQIKTLQTFFTNYLSCVKEKFSEVSVSLTSPSFYETEEELRKICFIKLFGTSSGNVCKWPSHQLVGPLYVNLTSLDFKSLFEDELNFVEVGGKWTPKDCTPRQEVAIIIPFRDRFEHLAVFLRQMHSIMKRQEYSYRIIVIEQSDEYPFNRGKLMNVGFQEALKLSLTFTCFIFHDVDLIPENDMNDYGCPTSPRHMSHAVDKFNYNLPYPGIFGGVEAFTRQDFERVNGFPNAYWGWGAEDDNLYKRVIQNGFTLTRPSQYVGRYKMIKHASSKEAPPNRHDKLNNAQAEFLTDGISSLQYKVLNKEIRQLYTFVQVDLNMEGDSIY